MRWRLSTVLLLIFLVLGSVAKATEVKRVMLKEKIGQMLMMGFKGMELHPEDPIVRAILAQQIGGVVLFDYDVVTETYDHNIRDPAQLKHLTHQLQSYAKQAAKQYKNHFIPLLIGVDYEGGRVNRLKEKYGFPKTLSAAEIGQLSPEEATRYATQMAETLKQAGININFAPVLDVNVNADNPVIGQLGRSFSNDPKKVSEYAAIFSKAYQQHGILCTYKHFPGHGSSLGDTHHDFVDITSTWKEYELEPYQTLFQSSSACPIVMTAHVVHYGLDDKGYPASLSVAMTQGLLRKKLHFEGIIMTDDLQMDAISDHYDVAEIVRLAINAGADILIFANQVEFNLQDPQALIEIIYQQVKTGKIPERRIEEAYQRIKQLKAYLHDLS